MAEPRVLVFAYSDLGVRCLDLLIERAVNVIAVYTHEDDPHEKRWFGSVRDRARKDGIPTCTPVRLGDPDVQGSIRALRPQLIFSFYYRRLIPDEILALAPLGAFNMHGSLLPRYRGRAPVNWAVLFGETTTGATLHHMAHEADAGDIVDQEAVPIGPEQTAGEVADAVADAAVRVLARRLDELQAGVAPRTPQDPAQATFYGRRRPEDGRIDWQRSPQEIVNLVRAVSHPFPGAFSDIPEGRLFVWRARACEGGGSATPGTVLSLDPPQIKAGAGGFVELLEWSGREGYGHSAAA